MTGRSGLAAPAVVALLYWARRAYAQTTLPSFSQLSLETNGTAAKFAADTESNYAWLTSNPTNCAEAAVQNASSWHINLGYNYVVHGFVLTGYNVPDDGGQRVEVRVGEQNPLTTSATVNSVCSAYTMVVGDPSSRHQCDRTSQARYVSVIAPDGGPLHVCAISLIVENPQGGRAPAPGPMPMFPAPLGAGAPQPIGPSNEMPVIPASGRPMQASMSAAEAPVGGPIVPRRPQRPALAPAQLPETGAPLNRIAAATQAATAPAPGPGAMLAIGPALPTVPRQLGSKPRGEVQVIAAGEPSAAPKSSPNAAAPEVPVVEAAAPAASPVGIATTTAEPAVPGTAEAVPHAGNLAAAAATASATHQDTPAAPPKAPVAGQPTPAAAGGGGEKAGGQEVRDWRSFKVVSKGPKAAPQVQAQTDSSNEPPLISTDFFPPVTTTAGLTQNQKIGIGIGTAAGAVALAGVAGVVVATRKRSINKPPGV